MGMEHKAGKDLEGGQTIWLDMIKFKVIACLFLNSLTVHPLVVMLVGEEDEEAQDAMKVSIHFYIIVTIMLVSIANKAYREEFCNNFEKDPFHEKLNEIKTKYKYTAQDVESEEEEVDMNAPRKFESKGKRDLHGLPITK